MWILANAASANCAKVYVLVSELWLMTLWIRGNEAALNCCNFYHLIDFPLTSECLSLIFVSMLEYLTLEIKEVYWAHKASGRKVGAAWLSSGEGLFAPEHSGKAKGEPAACRRVMCGNNKTVWEKSRLSLSSQPTCTGNRPVPWDPIHSCKKAPNFMMVEA